MGVEIGDLCRFFELPLSSPPSIASEFLQNIYTSNIYKVFMSLVSSNVIGSGLRNTIEGDWIVWFDFPYFYFICKLLKQK